MNTTKYPLETLEPDEDDGTMVENVAKLASHVVGHRIVAVERDVEVPEGHYYPLRGTALVLDTGRRVLLANTHDCCAYTALENLILHLDKVEHVITGVGTTDGYQHWHIYADLGDVVELQVGWSSGNPFYYGYGFDIAVVDPADAVEAAE